jgi:hypothetical protein
MLFVYTHFLFWFFWPGSFAWCCWYLFKKIAWQQLCSYRLQRGYFDLKSCGHLCGRAQVVMVHHLFLVPYISIIAPLWGVTAAAEAGNPVEPWDSVGYMHTHTPAGTSWSHCMLAHHGWTAGLQTAYIHAERTVGSSPALWLTPEILPEI